MEVQDKPVHRLHLAMALVAYLLVGAVVVFITTQLLLRVVQVEAGLVQESPERLIPVAVGAAQEALPLMTPI